MVKDVTDSNFAEEVEKSEQIVLVDFWAPWCGPCKMLAPVLDQLSAERKDVKIVKMNIDDNPEVPSKLGIRSIPTMMVYKDGKNLAAKTGMLPKSSIDEWINSIA